MRTDRTAQATAMAMLKGSIVYSNDGPVPVRNSKYNVEMIKANSKPATPHIKAG